VISGVSVLSDDSQSSAARLGGEVSLSFSRFCSFFGSWSRTQRGPAPRFPPRPRQFCYLEKTAHEECTVVTAAEGRHKFPSTLGMAGEERHKSLLVCILNVCSIGSALALPMTPSEEGPRGSSEVGRGSRGRVCAPGPHSWSFNTVQGVLAVHSSDLDKAHHTGDREALVLRQKVHVPRLTQLQPGYCALVGTDTSAPSYPLKNVNSKWINAPGPRRSDDRRRDAE